MKKLSALVALAPLLALVLAARPAAAETALALGITPSATRAKVGDYVAYTVRVENTGTETIADLWLGLGLPDALDARGVTCPGTTDGTVTGCRLGTFAPGWSAEVQFVVQVGAKEPNGEVTAWAYDGGALLASARIAPLKIVGPSR